MTVHANKLKAEFKFNFNGARYKRDKWSAKGAAGSHVWKAGEPFVDQDLGQHQRYRGYRPSQKLWLLGCVCNHCWNVRSTCYSTTHILAAPTITKLEGEKGAMLFMQHWIKAVNPIKHLPGPAVCIKLKRGNYHLCILGNKYRLLTIRGDLQPSAFFK